MKLEFSRRNFEKHSKTEVCGCSSSDSRVVPCGQTRQIDRQTDRWKDTTKLILAFRNFANAPKEGTVFPVHAMTVCTGVQLQLH